MLNTLSCLLSFPVSTNSVSMVIYRVGKKSQFIYDSRDVCNQEKKMDIESLSRIKHGIGAAGYNTAHACKRVAESVSGAHQEKVARGIKYNTKKEKDKIKCGEKGK